MENPLMKNKTFLFISEFISGVSVMGIEIASNRLLSPYLSSSQVVLTVITGIVLIAMSIGNILGGRLSDKHNSIKYLYIMMVISGIYVCIVPFVGKYVIAGIAVVFALFVESGLIIYTTILSCIVLIVPPLLILGMVTPSLIRYSLGQKASGKIIGSLEALNTTGSIIGTFLPTFLTIPYIGTMYTFIIFGSLLIILSLIFLITDFIINKGFGEGLKTVKTALFSLVAISIVSLSLVFARNIKINISMDSNEKIIEDESMYNYLKVEETDKAYYFSTNVLFGVQSMMRKDYSLTGMYYDYALASPYMANVYDKEKLNVLVLGNGTGTFATMMKHHLSEYDIDITAIEIDEKIIELGYEYFMQDETIKVYADDGRSYLNRDKNKYDVIMVDAYSSISAPFQMTTVEFFNEVNNHLTKDGVMVMNINMTSNEENSINQSLSDTASSVFKKTYTLSLGSSSNMLVYSSNNVTFMDDFKNNKSS
nr:fused MFS/spermidine synthase [Gammaproteobacteria bacterium]